MVIGRLQSIAKAPLRETNARGTTCRIRPVEGISILNLQPTLPPDREVTKVIQAKKGPRSQPDSDFKRRSG